MQFVRGAVKSELRPRSRVAASAELEDLDGIMVRDVEASWRRLVLRASWGMLIARSEVALMELVEIEPRALPAIKETSLQTTVSRAEILARPPLAASKSTRQHFHPKEGCRHAKLLGRGNAHNQWWTCKACASRWPK